MKYSVTTVPTTASGLRDAVVFTMAHASSDDMKFPSWCGLDFDGAFQQLFLGVENLRVKFGDAKADQLLDMIGQSKAHFESGDPWKGSWLTQDIERVIMNKPPFAYPEELYRWPR